MTATISVPDGNKVADFTPIRPILPILQMFTDVYRCFTDGDRCLPDGDRCLPDGSWGTQCCQPSKSCKNWKKYQKNAKRWVGNTVFAEELPDSSVLSVVIDVIGSHRCHQCHRLIIGYYRCDTRCIADHRRQNQHRLPEDIGNWQKDQNRVVSSSASVGHRVSQP